jgi:hypothetical protein
MTRSCFISYASEDAAFAGRLHADLVAREFECWFAPENLRSGEPFQESIEESIRQSEKVVVVLSKASLNSPWVAREVNAAREREDRENRSVLVPIRLDETFRDAWQPWAADLRRQRHIGNFTGWANADSYRAAFARLLRDLQAERRKPSAGYARPEPQQLERYRRQMLARVRHDWIDGFLHQSLYHVARLDLGLQDRPDLLDNPLTLLVQEYRKPPTMLPPGTKILALFDSHADAGGLMILGSPGAGKTTLLLELTRGLLDRALSGETDLIPVVFNLSSWAVRRAPLSEWFVDELHLKYSVPQKIAQEWVANGQILPLVDGLDEVALPDQEACAARITEFRGQQFLPMVVCSRLKEYESLEVKLRFPAAVVVQPLTREDVQAYLAGEGEALTTVRNALARDPTLWELFDSPLMLDVARLAFQDDTDQGQTLEAATLESRRTLLWAKYVAAMFQRRGSDTRYPPQQTLQWLVWLGSSMNRLHQSAFQLESLDKSWLPTPASQALLLCSIAFGGAFVGYFIVVAKFLVLRVLGGSTVFPILVLAFVPLMGILSLLDDWKPVDRLRWAWPPASRLGEAVGLPAAIGAFGGFAAGWLAGVLRVGPFLTREGLLGSWNVNLASAVGFGLLGFVGIAILGLLFDGMVTAEIELRASPNEGTWRSLRNARNVLLCALAIGIGGGLIGEPVGFRLFNLDGGLTEGLQIALSCGGILALFKGGGFALKHLCVRLLLWRYRYAPLAYVRFLDYATERIFLRRVGNGYLFVHRMLLEYFASNPPAPSR